MTDQPPLLRPFDLRQHVLQPTPFVEPQKPLTLRLLPVMPARLGDEDRKFVSPPRGEYLKLLLKSMPPGDEREAMLVSNLRLIEKCWEEMAELEAQTRGRDGHSLGFV